MGNYTIKTVWRLLKWRGMYGKFMFILARFVFFKSILRGRKCYIFCKNEKYYDPCMERGFLKVSGLNCSLLKPRSVNIYFIWFVFKLIVEQIYLKTILNPDFKFRDFLSSVFFHMSFMMSFFIPIYRIYFIFSEIYVMFGFYPSLRIQSW